MKKSNLVRVLTIAACLVFLSTTGYAWEDDDVRFGSDYNLDKGGDGWADYDYSYNRMALAVADVSITDSNSTTWAEADAYEVRKVYITEYDEETDPDLTATASCHCTATADAYYDTESSSYVVVAESDGWASGCGLSEYCDATAVMVDPDSSDTDSGYFSETADMSYLGATIFYGHSADADSTAYYTGGMVYLEGVGWSKTEVEIKEEQP